MKRFLSFVLLLFVAYAVKAQNNVAFTLTQAPCNNNGIVTANFTGLTTPINVTWYVGMQPSIVHTTNITSDVLNNYSGDAIWLIATGANNVTAAGSFSAPPFTIAVATVPATCPALGTATATITGGVPPYSYQWIDLGSSTLVSTSNPASLPENGYKLIVTDANGCSFYNDSVYMYANPAFSINVASTTASCTNGSATVNSITGGGTAPYSYLWSNGATTSSINNLTKGSYTVTVTDANGCHVPGYAFVSQSPVIQPNATTTSATCIQTNGSMIAFGSGGTPPYSYLWSNGGTGQSQNNVAAGYYSVTVTDANGCTGTSYTSVVSNSPITVTQSATPSSCTAATGSASLTISGGVAPYTVIWNTSPAQTGTSATGLAPGNYSFHITDANGCVRTGTVTVPPVNVITPTFALTNPSCTAANGSISVTPSGGTTPYTYSWSNSATNSTVNGLTSGSYTVTITDNVGCSITKTKTLTSTTPISIGFNTTQASCIYASDGATTAIPTGGTAPYTYSWSNSGNTATANNLATGNYWVHVSDANGCVQDQMNFVPYNPAGTSCYCTITGTVYDDVNGNCTQDAGEAGIPNIMIHCSNFGYAYTDGSGVYSFKVPTGNYTLSENVLAYYPLAGCQSNSISQSITASSGCVQTADFANIINPIHDMHISTWDYNQPVPGNIYNTVTIISNDGTVTEPNIVGGLETDNQIGAPSFLPSGVFTGSGNYFSLSPLSLAPGAASSVYSDFSVPTNIPLSTSLLFKDSIAYTAPISNWLNDYSPWNNVNYSTSVTVGSFDPNFKEVLPQGTGNNGLITPSDSVLEYMVHFQNTGTYYAQKVVVLDTLDADLDWSTLRPVYQSHPCVVTMDENGVVKFTFNNINLPSQGLNDMGSNGMLTYTIHTKKNLALGTTFTNNAAIYFDYNEPVITNTTLNTLGAPAGINNTQGNSAGSFTIYPNPAAKMFYARLEGMDNAKANMKITDISGKVVMARDLKLQTGMQNAPIDVATLSPGLYFVTVNSNGASQTQKLVIMK